MLPRLNTWRNTPLRWTFWSESGGVLSFASRDKDFPNRESAELVAMTLQDLKDRRALWHGKLKPQQRDEILRDIFHES